MNLRPILFPITFAALCLLSAPVFTPETFAAAPDSGFGDGGKVTVDLGSYGDQANAVLVQPDGKILAGGSTSNTADLDFMLFRLLPDGSLDREFNFDGTVSTAVGSHDDEVFAVALQDDGKILAAGYSDTNGNRDFALVRYNSDGTVDRSFGLEGMMVTAVSDSDDEISGIAVQEDGKILLTGSALGEQGRVVVLARYLSNGAPDFTFADQGFALSAVGTDIRAESLALSEEGRILVAGTYQDKENTALMVLGYDENGQLDSSFGNKGITVPQNDSVTSAGYGLAIRSDGSLLLAGSVGKTGERDGALFLFGKDGLPDRSFGDKGVLVTDDDKDTVFYDTIISDEMIAATGVTTGEDGMREALLLTYTKENGANSRIFQQQLAGSGPEIIDEETETNEPVAQVVITEEDNEEEYAYSLAAADAGSVVVVGASGAQEIASAAVRKYELFQSSVTGTSWKTETGNAYILTGAAQEVTRTTTLIPVKVNSVIGTVTEVGVVFSIDPLPVLRDSENINNDDTDDAEDDSDGTDDAEAETDETAPSITPSTESSFSPTEEVILVVSTDEDATCRYNAKYDEDYGEMEGILSSSLGTGHHVSLGTLPEDDDDDYTFYVRCKDKEGNINTSGTEVIFSVREQPSLEKDTTPPTITSTTSGAFADTDEVFLTVTTNEAAQCGYSKDYLTTSDGYTAMVASSDGITHKINLGDALPVGNHTYYVGCKDLSDNTAAVEITFTVVADVVGVTTSYFDVNTNTLSVTTDVDAHCKYRKGIDVDYDLMTDFVPTDSTLHEANLGTLAKGDYTYYVRCENLDTNEVTPVGTAISFTVASTTHQNYQTTPLFASSSIQSGLTSALESVGELFVSTAIAQDDTDDTTDSTDTTDTGDVDTEDSVFLEQGSVETGSGTGNFTARLEDLKPGTFFYARAYAIVDGTVYYGNQIGFQTADSCFVATAAYGSLFHPSVRLLRDFRDRFMIDNPLGRSLVRLYYKYSPPIADAIRSNTILRSTTRALLMPIVGSAWLTMRLGWFWMLLPAAALILLSWFGMRITRTRRQEAVYDDFS